MYFRELSIAIFDAKPFGSCTYSRCQTSLTLALRLLQDKSIRPLEPRAGSRDVEEAAGSVVITMDPDSRIVMG